MLFETASTRRQRGQVNDMTGTYDLVTALLFQHLVSQVINLAEAWPSVEAASDSNLSITQSHHPSLSRYQPAVLESAHITVSVVESSVP